MLPGIVGLHSVTGASAAASVPDPSSDPYWSNVKLLLGFNGADGATTSSDESPVLRGSPTFVGNAQLDTAQKKFGTGSLLLDGTGDYLGMADSADWNLGSGDFTIEAFIRLNALTGFQTIVAQWNAAGGHAFIFDFTGGNALRLGLATASSGADDFTQRTWTPSTGTWYHVCAERSGNTIRLYADGAKLGASATFSGTVFNSSVAMNIGALSDTGNYFNGWIDELRFTKGVARYASDSGFTVPASAYPRT